MVSRRRKKSPTVALQRGLPGFDAPLRVWIAGEWLERVGKPQELIKDQVPKKDSSAGRRFQSGTG